MMIRKASIDIGTNSTRLLIADVDPGGLIRPVSYQERITKLGSGLGQSGRLSSDSMERVLIVLQEYVARCRKKGVRQISLFATSATRDAANRDEFLTLIAEHTGFSCTLLPGEEEARLSFLGAISDMDVDQEVLVCDIGGGSTELVLGDKTGVIVAKSLDIGSRRMTSGFLRNDPASPQQVDELQSFLAKEISAGFAEFPETMKECVCVGGTATTLALMDAGYEISFAEKAHHYLLPATHLEAIIRNLAVKTIEERKSLIGLNPDRADVILAGALILKSVLKHFGCSSALVSNRDLLFGFLI